jgi:hypothetical protein
MSYDKRYSSEEIGAIQRRARRQMLFFLLGVYALVQYWDDLLMMLP